MKLDIKFGRSYASFGEDFSKIEFIEACFGKLVIFLSIFIIKKS